MQAFTQLDAVAAPLPQANVDTDQIVPALYLQKPRSAPFGDFLFHDVRRDASGAMRADFPLNQTVFADARILVAGPNFACGSSREHAVWALCDGGFRAVIAPSFGDIFHSNALKNGLLPITLAQADVQQLLATLAEHPGSHVQVDLQSQTVVLPQEGGARSFEIDPFARHCLLEGIDEVDYTLTQLARITQFEQHHEGHAEGMDQSI